MEVGADGKLGFEVAHLESDAAGEVGGRGDGELEVGAGGADAARRGGEADIFEEEAGARVAAAEGFEAFEVADGGGGAVGEGEGSVDGECGDEGVVGEFFAGVVVEALAEGVEVFKGEFDAAGHGVSAAGDEEVADVVDGEVEVEGGNGACGAVEFAA